MTQGDIGTDSIPSNCYCITFKEEQAGYLAGYAVVKDGYTKLGFLGGMAVPAVIRYGYGYVQGADAAAKELGTNIDINYFYGGQFYGDAFFVCHANISSMQFFPSNPARKLAHTINIAVTRAGIKVKYIIHLRRYFPEIQIFFHSYTRA